MQIYIVKHNLIYTNLLVDTAYHHLLIDRLVIASDKISVEVHIQIVHRAHIRKRLIYIDIIHIKGMLWQLESTASQKLCPVYYRMHQYVMSLVNMLYITPGKYLIAWKAGLTHNLFTPCSFFLVDIVGKKHINLCILLLKLSELIQYLLI